MFGRRSDKGLVAMVKRGFKLSSDEDAVKLLQILLNEVAEGIRQGRQVTLMPKQFFAELQRLEPGIAYDIDPTALRKVLETDLLQQAVDKVIAERKRT